MIIHNIIANPGGTSNLDLKVGKLWDESHLLGCPFNITGHYRNNFSSFLTIFSFTVILIEIFILLVLRKQSVNALSQIHIKYIKTWVEMAY